MINKIPPILIFLIYIISIFVFAFIYNSLPYEFYHSTVKYEDNIINDLNSIVRNMEVVLKTNLKKSHNSDYAIKDKDTFYVNSLHLSYLGINDYKIRFRLDALIRGFMKFNGKETYGDWNISPGIEIEFGYLQSDTLKNGIIQYASRVERVDSLQDIPIKLQDIFVLKNLNWKKGGSYTCRYDCGITLLPDSLNRKIVAYSNALEGFPSFLSGSFARMFYFSSVTITTIGYGDIVPLTTRTRLLVSVEAIWGITLLGLFLNSLAYKFLSKNE